MNDDKIEGVGKALRSSEYRMRALNVIAKIDPLSDRLAEAWADDVVAALRDESSLYTKFQILDQLDRIAQQKPQSILDAVPLLVSEVNSALNTIGNKRPEESNRVEKSTTVLRTIVEGTTPFEGHSNVDPDDVEAFFQRGGASHRAIAYRLLGRSASPEAVRELTNDVSYEVDRVLTARRQALSDARQIALQSIRGDDWLSPEDAAISFSELYWNGHAEADEETLQRVYSILQDILYDGGDVRNSLLRAVEQLTDENSDLAKTIVEEAFERIDEDTNDQSVAWSVLQRAAKGSPDVVVEHSDRLVELLQTQRSARTKSALKIVSTVSERGTSVPTPLLKATVSILDADDKSLVLEAIETVVSLGFSPPPPKLVALCEGNSDIAEAASEAQKKLSVRNDAHASTISDALREGAAVSVFDRQGDFYLKQRTDEGVWEDLDIGGVRTGVAKEIVEAVHRGENVPVVLPYYHPHEAVLAAVTVALSEASSRPQIGLYSPGSPTHWGTKGQVRDELERFALAEDEGDVVDAVPLPEVVPHAYVWDGDVRDASSGDGPGRLLLCKRLHDFVEATDLDIAFLNMTARTREDTSEWIQDLEASHPNVTLVNMYSYYTKNEIEGRPPYSPPKGLEGASTIPSISTLDPVVERGPLKRGSKSESCSTQGEGAVTEVARYSLPDHWTTGDDDVLALSTPATIRIDHVETRNVSSLLDQVFDQLSELRGVDDAGAGGLIFYRQLFFGCLPVPGEDFDEWVRERYYAGERYVPPLIEERIEDVERLANSIDALEAVRPLNKSVRLFEQIDQSLREQNPLFDRLTEYIDEARDTGSSLLVITETVKYAEILRYSLQKRDVVSRDELDTGFVSVVSPDPARDIDPHDTLVVFGALHRENAGFYVHPRVSETVVLTYDRAWTTMVERQANSYIDTLNEVVGGSDYSPYPPPDLVGDVEPMSTTEAPESTEKRLDESDPEYSASETPPSRGSGSESRQKSKAEILADAMNDTSTREYREDSGRYEREIRHYRIETEDGDSFELTNHDTILRQRTTDREQDYHWVNPEALVPGDTVVTIADDVEEQVWREQLHDLYEDGVSADQAVGRLEEWCEALADIWDRVDDELAAEGVATRKRVNEEIKQRIVRSNESFDRAQGTVDTWFNSVLDADSPVDLVEDPSLTIGPRSYRDIEAIGRTFEHEILVSRAKEIEAAMEGLRTLNRQKGRELHDEIRDQMNSGTSNRISEAAQYHVVKSVGEITEGQ